MLDRKSIYALNKKDRAAIVYLQADGQIVRLTSADFMSEEDFAKWKTWSDENYHDEEKRDHIHADHTLALTDLPDEVAAVPDAETVLARLHQRMEQKQFCALFVLQLRDILTPTQYRRLWLYHVEERTTREIAKAEGIRHQSVVRSLAAAKEKIFHFIEKQGAKLSQNPR